MSVPALAKSPAAPRLTVADIEAALPGPVPRVKVSWLYQLGLLLVAVAMVLLPAIYLAVIALAGWAVYEYAVDAFGPLIAHSHAVRLTIWLYLGPLIIGITVVVFLVKPLFAPRRREAMPYSLNPDNEPVLFALVAQVCRAVGAPMPRRIDVNTEVNASASFRRGLVSFVGHDLVLTIGLPLVAGMPLRQFTGILAHEFGHFAQGTGMRLTYVIRSVNSWFARVVYQRDQLDEALEQAGQSDEIVWRIVFIGARGLVWLTRRLLWVLMWIGQALSGFLLRQMEFDADRYEARVAGSEVFAVCDLRVHRLNLAHQIAVQEVQQAWNERRLADDLPAMVAHTEHALDPKLRTAFEAQVLAATTKAFDTHPSSRDRHASAAREAAPGCFTLAAPATAVFRDFAVLSRKVTQAFYLQVLGRQVEAKSLVPTATLLAERDERRDSEGALARYLQDLLPGTHPLVLDVPPLPPDLATLAGADLLQAQRAKVEALLASAGHRFRGAQELSGADFEQSSRSSPRGAFVAQYVALQQARLHTALALLDEPAIQPLPPDQAAWRDERDRLLPVARALGARQAEVHALRRILATASRILETMQSSSEDQSLPSQLMYQIRQAHEQLTSMLAKLPEQTYPFTHSQGQVSLAHYLLDEVPPATESAAIYHATAGCLTRYYQLYHRVLGRLAWLAERIEDQVGLPPLPPPPEAEKGGE